MISSTSYSAVSVHAAFLCTDRRPGTQSDGTSAGVVARGQRLARDSEYPSRAVIEMLTQHIVAAIIMATTESEDRRN